MGVLFSLTLPVLVCLMRTMGPNNLGEEIYIYQQRVTKKKGRQGKWSKFHRNKCRETDWKQKLNDLVPTVASYAPSHWTKNTQ
ncbi:hypothetical protein AMECASPLE_024341 [Ameca splendens]|uniref:Uncharacterized protein n=1 Tax=Ameca splendens TaxID=208324 RepID=A0ABV0XHB4_9TELE